jgi:hypothetical protein
MGKEGIGRGPLLGYRRCEVKFESARYFRLLPHILLISVGFFLFFSTTKVRGQDWALLDKYHETITREKFCHLLDSIYNPSKAVYAFLTVTDERVDFYQDTQKTILDFTLYFSQVGQAPEKIQRTFKTIPELQKLYNTKALPLKGVRIALDPGHIGGKWADVEERAVIWGNNPVIREGDKNLQVAKLLKSRLEAVGAEVYMTHDKAEPVTPLRAKDFIAEARTYVSAKSKLGPEATPKQRAYFERLVNMRAELYFYRRAEIAQRAENLRTLFVPDLNICNHFNATEKSGSRELVKDNRHVFFINGCYGPDEVVESVTRFMMFSKLLEQSVDIETHVADAITQKMLKVANLPPARFGREKYQCPVNKNPYLYARNLAASRQYPGPCIILEPFYMNNPWTAERLAAGDYDGVRNLAGGTYRSLVRDYADAVTQAIVETYSKWTVKRDESDLGLRID